MPDATETAGPSNGNLVPNQLAVLVPTFDPAKDDLEEYTKKVKLLLNMWPDKKWTELATRLILGCSGTAFSKLQLHSDEITMNEKKSIQRIIEILGGQWGQVALERKYEAAEKALYRCSQRTDENNDSYLARADVLWQDLKQREIKLEELQSYVVLRGSTLSSEDKKRVLLESEASTEGKLTMTRVSSAIRMLGAGFFQEMISGKKTTKLKTYDANALNIEHEDLEEPFQPTLHIEGTEEYEDDGFDTLLQEGDEDAALVAEFEAATTELVQNDDELAQAYNAYADARRRLNEKSKARGFFPVSQAKGRGKGAAKGNKGKHGRGHPSSRRSLQQRILESRCRLCGRLGHWKAECPQRQDPNRQPTAQTSFVQAQTASDHLDLEFILIPEAEGSIDVSRLSPVFLNPKQFSGVEIS